MQISRATLTYVFELTVPEFRTILDRDKREAATKGYTLFGRLCEIQTTTPDGINYDGMFGPAVWVTFTYDTVHKPPAMKLKAKQIIQDYIDGH